MSRRLKELEKNEETEEKKQKWLQRKNSNNNKNKRNQKQPEVEDPSIVAVPKCTADDSPGEQGETSATS